MANGRISLDHPWISIDYAWSFKAVGDLESDVAQWSLEHLDAIWASSRVHRKFSQARFRTFVSGFQFRMSGKFKNTKLVPHYIPPATYYLQLTTHRLLPTLHTG